MYRSIMVFIHVFLLSITLAFSSASAQNPQDATRVMLSFYSVLYSDIPEWQAHYNDNLVPVMEGMVADGSLTGFGVRMHHVGGKYNLRMNLAGTDDTNFEEVATRIATAAAAKDPEAMERTERMILSHYDEIWTLGRRNLEAPNDAAYVYENFFQVNRADVERWNELWESVLPVFDELMSQGLMKGYVVEQHNMGGEYNWKVLGFFNEWDDIDDAQARFSESVPLNHEFWTLPIAHKDEIWARMPEMN
jgi:hypothetical protein